MHLEPHSGSNSASEESSFGHSNIRDCSHLLDKGRTLYSRCKVPTAINEESTCHISQWDSTAELFRQVHLLVIDEVTMGHRYIFEAIDRTLRDIWERGCMFSGLTLVIAGDWRQALPVVQHGSRSDIVNA